MFLVKVRPRNVGHLTRYRSTCGRCGNSKTITSWPYEIGRQLPVVETSEEAPSELVAIIHH
jgi:hypothetical protein